MSQTINATGFYTSYVDNNDSTEVGNHGEAVNGALRFEGITLNQGTTVQSAILRFYVGAKGSGAGNLKADIYGIDEDNTGSFSGSPLGRASTSAHDASEWSLPPSGEFSEHNVTSIVQEIVDRAGWLSGNAMGFKLYDNGSPSDVYAMDASVGTNSQLVIVLSSPSSSVSSSVSSSPSPSSSVSSSPSVTPSATPSPSPAPPPAFPILRIAKPGVNVLANSDVWRRVFDSDYGTLKYFTKQQVNLSFDASTGDITVTGSYTHNLGYYPYVEVYVSVYIGSPTGVYEYCPFAGAGATVLYDANYKITSTTINVYGQINGVSSSVWHFDFLIFVFKNNLNL